MHLDRLSLWISVAALVLLTACAPSQGASTAAGPAQVAQPAPEKSMTIAVSREITSFDESISGTTGGGAYQHARAVAYDGLMSSQTDGTYELRLATKQPTLENRDWVVNADGSMDMTWHVRQDAKWHDGVPVTAEDYVFAHTVRADPEVSKGQRFNYIVLITRATVIDPYTFTTHWQTATLAGKYGDGLAPLPKHILESAYLGPNKEGLGQLRYFLDEFIGTGPFKLNRFERGAFISFDRFDQYYKGPAHLSHLTLTFVTDPNTIAASFLAGAIDAVLPNAIDLDLGLALFDRFAKDGSGNRVQMDGRGAANNSELMVDPVFARPIHGMTQQLVRQALLQAIDRQDLMETMTHGTSQVANNPYDPQTPTYQYVKAYVESPTYPWTYPYDVRKAQQLLASAGWVKGSDGMLVDQTNGDKFDYQILVRPGAGGLKEGLIIQDYWKAVGVNLEVHVLTPVEQASQIFIGQKSGSALITSGAQETRRYHSNDIPREENRYAGSNRGRWSDPRMDALIMKIETTIDTPGLQAAYRAYTDEVFSQVSWHPYYWEILPTLIAKGVTTAGSNSTNNTWSWDKN